MKKNVAVSIKNVSKTFHLPQDNRDSIKTKLIHALKGDKDEKSTYRALEKINFDIKKGEFIGVLGRNGAGKSTLLKIIAQIYQPTTGSVQVDGLLVPFIELGVGFNKDLSGRDNVYLNGAMLGFSRDQIDEMYDSIVDFAELHKFMHQKLRNYSSGMRVRLAFSIAIKADADILLIDEVLAVGDAAFRRKCHDYFNTLKRSDKTIIFVTHNMGEIKEYCDRAVLIEGGKTVFDGTPEEATEKYFELFNAGQASESEVDDDKQILINDVSASVSGDNLLIEASISNLTDKQFNDILMQFSIRRHNGRVVAGFDNKNIDEPFEIDLGPKESRVLAFESPNIIGSGDYLVNAAVLSSDEGDKLDDQQGSAQGSVMYDRKPNVASFSVERPGANTPIVLPASLSRSDRNN